MYPMRSLGALIASMQQSMAFCAADLPSTTFAEIAHGFCTQIRGSGGFVVGEGGSLTLEHIALLGDESADGSAQLTVRAGGRLSVADSLLVPSVEALVAWAQPTPLPCDGTAADGVCRGPHAGPVVLTVASSVSLSAPLLCEFWSEDCAALPAGVTAEQRAEGLAAGIPWNADPICFLSADHIMVPDDQNLLASAGQGVPPDDLAFRCDAATTITGSSQGRGPFGLNRSGTGWYRFPANKALPTAPAGPYHCGTESTGWLSGWADDQGQPDEHYATPADGSLPAPVGAPPAAAAVCFDSGHGLTCQFSTVVRAVSCGTFALWEMPPAPADSCSGYCSAPDPCESCAAAGQCTAGSWGGYPHDYCANDDSTTDRWGYTCSDNYDSHPGDCGQRDDEDFTAAVQCCGCGGAAELEPGHCACAAGWTGALCAFPVELSLPPGMNQEQHDRAIAAGVDPAADEVCFTAAFHTVPDDPSFSISAGQGGSSNGNSYDPTMPDYRCDAAEGATITSGGENGHGPFGLRQGHAGWYRLPAGKTLPTTPSGGYHCGTKYTGWLSGKNTCYDYPAIMYDPA